MKKKKKIDYKKEIIQIFDDRLEKEPKISKDKLLSDWNYVDDLSSGSWLEEWKENLKIWKEEEENA